MQIISDICFFIAAFELIAAPVLLVIWIIRKIIKKPKWKWFKWFWISFAVLVVIGGLIAPGTWCKHEYILTERKEPTCTDNGYEKYHCDLCNSDKTETVKKLGHLMVDVHRIEPTNGKDGEYVQRCSRCGYEIVEILPMLKKPDAVKEQVGESVTKAEETESTVKSEVPSETAPEISSELESNRKDDETVTKVEGFTESPVTETAQEASIVDGWSEDVSDDAQIVLSMIVEDVAKQIAKNPSTVKMSIFSAGFAKNGHLYAVQQEFSCSNLMGVSEKHVVKVICESNEDESKIQPFEVWLDGNLIQSQDRIYDQEG